MRWFISLLACSLLRFSGSAAEYSVPFEPGSVVVGKVTIKGMEMSAFFDTGAAKTGLSIPKCERLGLERLRDAIGGAAGGTVDLTMVKGAAITIQGLPPIEVEEFACIDMAMPSAAHGRELSVVIGRDVMNSLTLSLDHDKGMATLATRDSVADKVGHFPARLPLEECLGGLVGIAVDGFEFPIIVDTGSDGSFQVAKGSFSRLLERSEAAEFSSYSRSVGLAGEFAERNAWLRRFSLAGFPPCAVQVGESSIGPGSERDALIGMDVLRNWNWLIDFEGKTAYLGKSKYFGQPVLPDASGLRMLRPEQKAIVARPPRAESPAALAGIRIGDVILSCNGKPVSEMSMPALRDELSRPTGTKVNLEVEREGKKMEVTLTLKCPLDAVLK